MYAIKRKNINANSLKNEDLYLYHWDMNKSNGYEGLNFKPIRGNRLFHYCYCWSNIDGAIEAIEVFNRVFNHMCPEMEVVAI